MLSLHQVDVNNYIETEKRLHPDGFVLYRWHKIEKYYNGAKCYIFVEDPIHGPTVSWEWYIPPESSAYLVLTEFKIMCLRECRFWWTGPPQWQRIWPFHQRSETDFEGWHNDRLSPKELKIVHTRYARKAIQREERQNHYNPPHEYRPRRRRNRNRMPGSWTEDKSDYTNIYHRNTFSIRLPWIPNWLIILSLLVLGTEVLIRIYPRQVAQ